MALRARLQGLVLGSGTALLCMGTLSRDVWDASARLGDAMQSKGLVQPRPVQAAAPVQLRVVEQPDWSVETKVDAIRSWNDHVREWHRVLAKKIFQ